MSAYLAEVAHDRIEMRRRRIAEASASYRVGASPFINAQVAADCTPRHRSDRKTKSEAIVHLPCTVHRYGETTDPPFPR